MALSEDSFNARRSKTWVRLSQSWTVRKQLNISRRNSQVAPVRDSPPLKPLIRLSDAAVTVIRRRATLTNHSTQSTMDASCTPGCCTRRISCRSCHGHLVGCPCMVAVVVIVETRKLMSHYCLSTLSRLHAAPACIISITILPSNDLCIRALLSVSAAVLQRVGLEK